MPEKAGWNIENIFFKYTVWACNERNEILRSQEWEGLKIQRDSSERQSSQGWGSHCHQIRSETFWSLGHSGRPCEWEAAPQNKMVKHCFLLSLNSRRRRQHPLWETITSSRPHTAEARIYVTRVSQYANLAWTGLQQVVSPGTQEKQVQVLSDPGLKEVP